MYPRGVTAGNIVVVVVVAVADGMHGRVHV